MRAQTAAPAAQNRRIVAGLPFVEALARRMAASMPNSIDIGDLMQDGVLGPTHIQVDWKPVLFNHRIEELGRVLRIGKAQVIPA